MKQFLSLFSVFLLSTMPLALPLVFAFAESPDSTEGKAKQTKEEPKVSPEGFKLSEPAIKTLGLRYEEVSSALLPNVTVPTKSLVYFQDEVGVYRFRNGLFKLLEVEIVKKSPSETTIKAAELKPNDQIVVDGVPLLRVADLQIRGGPVDVD